SCRSRRRSWRGRHARLFPAWRDRSSFPRGWQPVRRSPGEQPLRSRFLCTTAAGFSFCHCHWPRHASGKERAVPVVFGTNLATFLFRGYSSSKIIFLLSMRQAAKRKESIEVRGSLPEKGGKSREEVPKRDRC